MFSKTKTVANCSIALAISLSLSSCGPRAFTKGDYDDPTRVELLDDKFNEADMQQMASDVIGAIVECKYIRNAKKEPIVIVDRVQNRTEEHIDMLSLTNKVRDSLINSGKVKFVDKAGREALDEEYAYSASGAVSGPTQKKRGKQIGADYLLRGALSTNIQQLGARKLIYYKLTMHLTNLDTSIIDCSREKEVRKVFKKRQYDI